MFSLSCVLGVGVLLAGFADAGTTVWSGSFDYYNTVADFDKWSWANQTGQYQWYIHGTEATSNYLALGSAYKNPAITSESKGLKLTISPNATWNSQMERTELIPQTSANLGTGTLFYHFSVMRSTTNAPDSTLEHQVMFFESHFTELKYGVSPTQTDLQWMVSGVRQWGTPFTAGTWFNFAYEINFSSGNVGLWASTGSAALTKVVNNVSASTYTNSADFHVGVLRIVNGGAPEDWHFSGVYIESGPITTTIGNGNSTVTTSASSGSTSAPASTTVASTTIASSTTSAAGATQTQWGQCGGINWAGPSVCSSGYTCVVLNDYYYQCQ